MGFLFIIHTLYMVFNQRHLPTGENKIIYPKQVVVTFSIEPISGLLPLWHFMGIMQNFEVSVKLHANSIMSEI